MLKLLKLRRAVAVMAVAVMAGSLLSPPVAQAADPPRYRIKSFGHAGYCLDGNSGNGGGVYIWSCVNAKNQYWYFDFIGSEGFARIRNAKTGLCLRVQGGVAYPSPIVNGDCGNTWDAWWKGIDVLQHSRDYYRLTPYYMRGSYCINAPNRGNGFGTINDRCLGLPDPYSFSNYWTWELA
jgi:hypothetical protein